MAKVVVEAPKLMVARVRLGILNLGFGAMNVIWIVYYGLGRKKLEY